MQVIPRRLQPGEMPTEPGLYEFFPYTQTVFFDGVNYLPIALPPSSIPQPAVPAAAAVLPSTTFLWTSVSPSQSSPLFLQQPAQQQQQETFSYTEPQPRPRPLPVLSSPLASIHEPAPPFALPASTAISSSVKAANFFPRSPQPQLQPPQTRTSLPVAFTSRGDYDRPRSDEEELVEEVEVNLFELPKKTPIVLRKPSDVIEGPPSKSTVAVATRNDASQVVTRGNDGQKAKTKMLSPLASEFAFKSTSNSKASAKAPLFSAPSVARPFAKDVGALPKNNELQNASLYSPFSSAFADKALKRDANDNPATSASEAEDTFLLEEEKSPKPCKLQETKPDDALPHTDARTKKESLQEPSCNPGFILAANSKRSAVAPAPGPFAESVKYISSHSEILCSVPPSYAPPKNDGPKRSSISSASSTLENALGKGYANGSPAPSTSEEEGRFVELKETYPKPCEPQEILPDNVRPQTSERNSTEPSYIPASSASVGEEGMSAQDAFAHLSATSAGGPQPKTGAREERKALSKEKILDPEILATKSMPPIPPSAQAAGKRGDRREVAPKVSKQRLATDVTGKSKKQPSPAPSIRRCTAPVPAVDGWGKARENGWSRRRATAPAVDDGGWGTPPVAPSWEIDPWNSSKAANAQAADGWSVPRAANKTSSWATPAESNVEDVALLLPTPPSAKLASSAPADTQPVMPDLEPAPSACSQVCFSGSREYEEEAGAPVSEDEAEKVAPIAKVEAAMGALQAEDKGAIHLPFAEQSEGKPRPHAAEAEAGKVLTDAKVEADKEAPALMAGELQPQSRKALVPPIKFKATMHGTEEGSVETAPASSDVSDAESHAPAAEGVVEKGVPAIVAAEGNPHLHKELALATGVATGIEPILHGTTKASVETVLVASDLQDKGKETSPSYQKTGGVAMFSSPSDNAEVSRRSTLAEAAEERFTVNATSISTPVLEKAGSAQHTVECQSKDKKDRAGGLDMGWSVETLHDENAKPDTYASVKKSASCTPHSNIAATPLHEKQAPIRKPHIDREVSPYDGKAFCGDPMFRFKLKLPDGKLVYLAYFEEDEPEAVAHRFCRVWHVSTSFVPMITKRIHAEIGKAKERQVTEL